MGSWSWDGEEVWLRIEFLFLFQDMGGLELARAILGSRRGWVPKLQPRLSRFYSSTVTKTSETSSSLVEESPSASASEHVVTNAAEANLKSRTWDEHRLTADQLLFRSLASVRDHIHSQSISQFVFC